VAHSAERGSNGTTTALHFYNGLASKLLPTGADLSTAPLFFPRSGTPANAGPLTRPELRIVILSAVRFLRESLSEILGRDPGIAVLGHYAALDNALDNTLRRSANFFLLDAAFDGGTSAVRQIREVAPEVSVVVLAVVEARENVVTWAEAGVAGYIPSSAALTELATLLRDISNGKQACSDHVAAALLRRIARDAADKEAPVSPSPLTPRELQILELIDEGLSNKEIARRLVISLGTTKSHVHSLLGKLNVPRRGQAAALMRRGHKFIQAGPR
jgi:two-component system, NarL family, nitrate/nitrite response regulator NarL